MELRAPELIITTLLLAACASSPDGGGLSDHPFDGETGFDVLQHDATRYTLRYYAPPQTDATAMENLLLHRATQVCGHPGFRRTEPVLRNLSQEAVRTPDLVNEFEQHRAPGPEILHWIEVDVDCDPAYD